MRFQKSILCLLCLFVILTAYGKAEGSYAKIDSMYTSMSDLEKISQLIWIKADSADQRMSHAFGGVYYQQPMRSVVIRTDQTVAVQLDHRLLPMIDPSNKLPDLFTLASLQNQELLSTYYQFLKSYAKSHGIDYLILPAYQYNHSRQDVVIRQMHAFDPEFFIQAQALTFELTKKKKDIANLLTTNSFWIVNETDVHFLEKKLYKYASSILAQIHPDERIKLHLIHSLYRGMDSPITMPKRLTVEIGRESVISLGKKPLLPLQEDTICFLTNEPYGAMANMLRKYSFIITEYQDIIKNPGVIVIDNDALIPEMIPLANRNVVFTGTREHLLPIKDQVDAALLYHLKSDIYSYLIPQQIFGSHGTYGLLPNHDGTFLGFDHLPLEGLHKLGYAPPEMTGLDEQSKLRIQEIIREAITTGSTPGVQLAVAVDGSIILEEAYGFLTYDSLVPVDKSTLYDLASVTKVSATLLAIMKLYEDGLIDLDIPIKNYLPEYEGSNKSAITIRALLAHNAGLRPYVSFWQRALNADFVEPFYYKTEEDERNDKRTYGIQPSELLLDSLKNWIVQSPLLNYDSIPGYRYSDIGFMILHQIIESVAQQSMDSYLYTHFYEPMGLKRTLFNPQKQGYELFEIAPTEFDDYFRDEMVWGQVHDRNAAVFGGVAGHAGLFSNAHELMILLQTLLQEGQYGGIHYLSSETVNYFNQKFFEDNRRALGWDKPSLTVRNTSSMSSDSSFGHTGFTGTMVWADPAYELIFVFLSNRIHPTSNNYQLIRRNIRTRIQDVVYEALLAKWMN